MPRSHSLAIAETIAARLLRLFSLEDAKILCPKGHGSSKNTIKNCFESLPLGVYFF